MTDAATRPTRQDLPTPEFLAGGGGMGALIQRFDWSRTSLGPTAGWPQSLRTAVQILLRSPQPLVMLWGADGVMIYNDAYAVLAGGRHPALLGAPVEHGWPEVAAFNRNVIAVGQRGETLSYHDQHLVLHRHGRPEDVWMNLNYSPVLSEDGSVGGVLCVVSETTRRVVGERRLRTLRALGARMAATESVEATCRAAMATLSAESAADLPYALLYLFSDQAARLIAAYGARQHGAGPIGLDAGGGEPARLLTRVRDTGTAMTCPAERMVVVPPRAMASGHVLLQPITAGKTPLGVLVTGLSSQPDPGNEYRSFLGLVADQIAKAIVTAKTLEEERARARALAELDRAKTVFFSNISHEFRTPLTLMLGPLEQLLALDPSDLPAHRDDLATAHRNGLRLLRLVNALLDFARVEAGRAQASYQAVDLAALTADLASAFRSACQQAGLRLAVDCPTLPAPVWVDRDMWEKIVLNLVSNAFKFTFEGTIEVSLGARGDAVALAVRDTGTGIAQHQLRRVFERFHQIEDARGRTQEGSGIGLALVQELVGLHGGTIAVESELDRGTTFTVTLPFGKAHLPPDRIGAAPGGASTATGARAFVEEALRWLPDAAASNQEAVGTPAPARGARARARVLLADDNADMRLYVRRLLAHRYDIDTVADGAAALAAVRARPPDLVLSDAMMPGLDGIGLVRALRADPGTRSLPIILLSARTGEEAAVEGLEAGADDYLTKPFGVRELVARVRANLELARMRHAASHAVRTSEARLRLALDAGRMGTWEWDLRARKGSWDERLAEIFGIAVDRPLTRKAFLERVHPDDLAGLYQIVNEALAKDEPYDQEFRIIRPDGEVRWLAIHGDVIRDEQGLPVRVVGLNYDITERKREVETQRVLMDELNHRVRNTLAIVSSIATQTLKHSPSVEHFRGAFGGRIGALAKTHTLLAASKWGASTLQAVIEQQLDPFIDGRTNAVAVAGPKLLVNPKQALTLSLVLHELAGNAAKYGALSVPGGRVDVRWRIDPERSLRLTWTESGGPQITAPRRRGFGSQLIEFNVAHEFGGQATLDYRPDGVVCALTIPLPDSDRF